jgi:hypothetical protein
MVVVLVLAAGVGFWNLHLRTVVGAYESAVASQSDALRDLASGVLIDAELADGVTGRMVATDERLAFTLAGLDVDADDVVTVWTTDADGVTTMATVAPGDVLDGGTYAGVVAVDDVTAVTITLESGPPGAQPAGRELARSDLVAVATGSDG